MRLDRQASTTVSRRIICLGLVALAAGASCERNPCDDATDDLLLARIVSSAAPRLPKRTQPYIVSRPVRLPAGTTLMIEAGVHVVIRGVRDQTIAGVFEALGDNVSIIAEGAGALIESQPAALFIYATSARGVSGLTVVGLHALNCHHVRVDGGTEPLTYAGVKTSGAAANVVHRVRVRGGGARFDQQPTGGHGSCLMRYVNDWVVEDCAYDNVLSGVEWWGGDANPVTGDGAAGKERKCGTFRISRVTARHTTISGIWGSMGHNGVIENCSVSDCGDVGFDAEGCDDVTFRSCDSRDAANGCFGTFFLNRRITFEDCTATATRASLPVFRVHNPTLDMANNRAIVIRGGRWTCTDPSAPSSIDTGEGPCGEFTLEGAHLTNVVVDTAFIGVNRTRIIANSLSFPIPLTRPAIRVGGSKTLGSPAGGQVRVERNVVHATKAATVAIQVFEDDTISSASSTIVDNRITGPFQIGINLVNASPNPTVLPTSDLANNTFDLPPKAVVLTRELAGTGVGRHRPIAHWRSGKTGTGRAITAAEAMTLNR